MDEKQFMTRAIQLAKENVLNNGGPFGAVVVLNGEIVGEGVNRVTASNDPTAHAEVQAIRNACSNLGTFKLSDCVIFSSCEPCPMCFSAIYWARISKVYYAATHYDADLAGFDDGFLYRELAAEFKNRKIPFQELKHELKLAPFNEWGKKNDKTRY